MDPLRFFRIEAQDHLEGLSDGLLTLEQDPQNEEALKSLFRMAHTLKGSARMVSLTDLGDVAHKMEDVLGAIREGDKQATETVISAMLAAVTVIEGLLASASDDGPPPPDFQAVIDRLSTLWETQDEEDSAPDPAPEAVSDAASDEPPQEKKKSGLPASAPLPEWSDDNEEEVLAAVYGAEERSEADGVPEATVAEPAVVEPAVSDPAVVEPTAETGPQAEVPRLKITLDKVDRLVNLTSELLIHHIRFEDQNRYFQAVSQDAQRAFKALAQVQEWINNPEVKNLLDQVTDTKVMRADLSRLRSVELANGIKACASLMKGQISQLDQLSSALHDGVMDLRMLPASTLTTPLKLVVRETAIELGRKVRLKVEGENIDIDKALLEGIREPLAHLIRNAVDHGIELPEERVNAGKEPYGEIHLSFRRRGARIQIEVRDDGRGIHLEKIKKIAVSKGFMDPFDAETARPAELYRCLLKPGFSTTKGVSKTSGRGVGMDVVASNIKALKGTVEIASKPGQGMTVGLHLPVNLSTMDGFMFESDGRTFAVTLSAVEQVRRFNPDGLGRCADRPVIEIDHHSVPYISMRSLLAASDTDHPHEVVVLRSGDDQLALGIDRVVGVRTMIVKPLPIHVGELPMVSGMTVLADGRPAVIADVAHLLAMATRLDGGSPITDDTVDEPVGQAGSIRVLVVDDSLSARMMHKGLLESAGHHVTLAVDGEDGWLMLKKGNFDLVISDLEMPRLDGWSFVRRIRQHAETRDCPVIVMSSLATEADQQKGFEAGANAYLVKGEVNQRLLEETVERLVGGNI